MRLRCLGVLLPHEPILPRRARDSRVKEHGREHGGAPRGERRGLGHGGLSPVERRRPV
ncbi:hypothetical protein STXM2123_2510 [Streptomyces sp. F-3]|nr:hypothetical protein STXM2123_2510 [Streptomyces sp. F-3]